MDPAKDLASTDIVFRDGFTENFSVYHNPMHKWYYLHGQRADEIWLFRQSDTQETMATGRFQTLRVS
jgi:hypothetical protein